MTLRITEPRATFQEQVLDQLGREIGTGVYRPGQVLPSELELCERFGFSRIVIREAIKSLAAKGMIEVRRRVGTLVLDPGRWNLFDPGIMAWRAANAEFDPVLAHDLMELRRIVEPAAVRLAATRASDEQRRALRAAYMAMARAVAGKGDYVEADLSFHTVILAASGNQFVQQMQQAMSAVLSATFDIITEKPGGPALSLPLHEAVCLAIERRDADSAERAALTLIDSAKVDLDERLALIQAGRAPGRRRAPARASGARR